MKNPYDPRHLNRVKKMQSLFAYSFSSGSETDPDILSILPNLPEIDEQIKLNAPKWPLDKINRIDLSILRLAFFELFFEKTAPPKVVIDEAVEMAKEFGSEHSFSFINGVLGSAVKSLPLETHESQT